MKIKIFKETSDNFYLTYFYRQTGATVIYIFIPEFLYVHCKAQAAQLNLYYQ